MKRFILLAALAVAGNTSAQDTTKALFIGNSFTNVYDVPSLVSGLAAKAGFPFSYYMHAPNGMSVGDTSQGTSAHMNNPVVFDLIRQGNWDYVSLQDNQGRFVRGGGIFPDTNVSKVIRGHLKIRDSVNAYNSCAQMLWFSGWAWKNGYPGVAPNAQGLINNIYENYKYLEHIAGGIIAPIGIAWERAVTEMPSTNLWGPDDTHQSLAGAYLTASVIFTSIFKINTELVFYNGGLDSTTARGLRRIAYQVVKDSAGTTNLTSVTPELTVTTTLLTATPGFTNYQWYQNGTSINSGTTNTQEISSDGCFYVVTTDTNGCEARSFTRCPATTNVLAVAAEPEFNVYPIPASTEINIAYNTGTAYLVSICDATGRIVFERAGNARSGKFAIDNLPAGTYLLKVTDGTQVLRKNIVIVK